jgi:hypothetical protein
MRVAIYARVSTDDKGQDPENQLRELRGWGSASGHTIVQEFVDRQSGRRGADKRQQFARPGRSSTAYCFGHWTASAAKVWRKRLLICSALHLTAWRSTATQRPTYRRTMNWFETFCWRCFHRWRNLRRRRSANAQELAWLAPRPKGLRLAARSSNLKFARRLRSGRRRVKPHTQSPRRLELIDIPPRSTQSNIWIDIGIEVQHLVVSLDPLRAACRIVDWSSTDVTRRSAYRNRYRIRHGREGRCCGPSA